MMKGFVLAATLGLAGASAHAQVSAYVGTQGFGSIDGVANFESFPAYQDPGSNPFSDGGMDFFLTGPSSGGYGSWVIWGSGGGIIGLPTQNAYVNGGGQTMISIKRSDGQDFAHLEFDVGNGQGADPEYIWARAYNNGSPTGYDFDMDVSAGSTLAFIGANFDEIRVAAYNNPTSRDLHSEIEYNAPGIDNVTYGDSIPTPGGLALLGLGGVVAARRRR